MRTLKLATALKQIKEGRFECLNDIKVGYIQIRKANGKSEMIEIIE